MNLECPHIVDLIRADFGQLWNCKKLGNTLAITTPYTLPNREALTLYVTTREDRIIVSDAGRILKLLAEESCLAKEELEACRDYFMFDHDIALHLPTGRDACFFKETKEIKLLPSLFFDLGNFAMNFCGAAIPYSVTEEATETSNFSRRADDYLKGVIRHLDQRVFNKKWEDMKNVTFGAIISLPDYSHTWLVSYVTGPQKHIFTRNLASAIVNFTLVRRKRLVEKCSFLTLVNNESAAYHPNEQEEHFAMLRKVSERAPILWTHKEEAVQLLAHPGPKLTKWQDAEQSIDLTNLSQ